MFQPPSPAGAGHGAHVPPTIAMGGGTFAAPAADGSTALRRHPEWIKARLPSGENYHDLKRILRGLTLNTVCEEAHCPNIGECWEQRTATIMILGDVCTRACGFCAVKTGRPTWNDEDEPRRVAEAIAEMNLEHVVVTSVARDDLPDGGAGVFAETIRRLRQATPGMGIEVLIPDFNGNEHHLRTVMEARPDILNHNLETVERLQKPNGAIIVNKVLGARLALSGSEIEAIRFESRAAKGEYFDGTGKSLKASFLRAPVNFRRISSIFGGRRHPVLGVWRRHKGTDYAAAQGTPVRAVGDGVVVFAGRKGGYGNTVDIRHRNGYVSRYGHLRNFAKGVSRGKRVTIGSTIGAVGQTGLATGPHLHFEVLVNGVQRDPRIALQMKGGEPIPSSERGVFQQLRSRTLATLAMADN